MKNLNNSKSQNLPNEIIENILLKRELYILIQHHPEYDNCFTMNFGIFGILRQAKINLIKHALSKINAFEYAPENRYIQASWGNSNIIDSWTRSTICDRFFIEIWKQNIVAVPKVINFHFDCFFKKYIIENDLKTEDQIENTLTSWKENIPEILFTLFNKKSFFSQRYPDIITSERSDSETSDSETVTF